MNTINFLRYNYRSTRERINEIFYPHSEFTKRILNRYHIFWTRKNSELNLPLFFAKEPSSSWENGDNWQRVLNNKHNSREFAIKHGCQVPDLYWRGKNYSSIDFGKLPKCYVIKPTIGSCSRGVFLMREEVNLFDGKKYSEKDIVEYLISASKKNPKVEFIFEEFLRNERGDFTIPIDYKFYTFNGNIACIRLINRQGPQNGSGNYYDENWNLIPTLKTSQFTEGDYQDPPTCLEEMKNCARKLSEIYKLFVRIDFYATNRGAVFGEFTPTPSHGKGYSKSGSDFLVKYWDTYCRNMI